MAKLLSPRDNVDFVRATTDGTCKTNRRLRRGSHSEVKWAGHAAAIGEKQRMPAVHGRQTAAYHA
jgi:hypothetical protein